jgi:UDP-2,3-diacylglucosamine pyrophosphatase LpxH
MIYQYLCIAVILVVCIISIKKWLIWKKSYQNLYNRYFELLVNEHNKKPIMTKEEETLVLKNIEKIKTKKVEKTNGLVEVNEYKKENSQEEFNKQRLEIINLIKKEVSKGNGEAVYYGHLHKDLVRTLKNLGYVIYWNDGYMGDEIVWKETRDIVPHRTKL